MSGKKVQVKKFNQFRFPDRGFFCNYVFDLYMSVDPLTLIIYGCRKPNRAPNVMLVNSAECRGHTFA